MSNKQYRETFIIEWIMNQATLCKRRLFLEMSDKQALCKIYSSTPQKKFDLLF